MKIRFLFCKNRGRMSSMIRTFTMGDYSHVAIQLGDDVYEAHTKKGVHKQTYQDRRDDNYLRTHVDIEVDDNEYNLVQRALTKQLGKKYDRRGVLQHLVLFRLRPGRPGHRYCSELAMLVLETLGLGEITELVSPHRFYERVHYLYIGTARKKGTSN